MQVFGLKNSGQCSPHLIFTLSTGAQCQSLRNPHTFNVINPLISFSMNESAVLSIKCDLIITWGLCHCYFLYISPHQMASNFPFERTIKKSNPDVRRAPSQREMFSASEVSQPLISPQYPDYCTRTGFNMIHNGIIRYGVLARRLYAQIASTMEMNKRFHRLAVRVNRIRRTGLGCPKIYNDHLPIWGLLQENTKNMSDTVLCLLKPSVKHMKDWQKEKKRCHLKNPNQNTVTIL